MRQIVWHCPDPSEYWKKVCVSVCECELDGLRRGRRLSAQECGLEVEESDDERRAIVQRCGPDQPNLKRHVRHTKQPRLTLEPANERIKVAVQDRAADLLHDKRFPRSGRRRVPRSLLDEVLDEGEAAHASINVPTQFGIERDGSCQQQ